MKSRPLAIIGSACYLPGSSSLEEYWENLFHERIFIGVPGPDRFDDSYYSPVKGMKGRTYSKLAATFDYNEFCRCIIPEMEKEFNRVGKSIKYPRSPGALLALYTAMESLRNAGLDPFDLRDPFVGLFCGLVSVNNYYDKIAPVPHLESLTELMDEIPSWKELDPLERARIQSGLLQARPEKEYESWKEKFLGKDNSNQLVRFIHHSLGLTGSAFCFDSACSSSLMGLEIARNYLENGKQVMAIVGGMTYFKYSGLTCFAAASANSERGAHPFDDRADGLVPGEGCAFSLVKLLDRAIADGDHILGVIRGIGFSSDGRGKGLWAPSATGQTLAMKRAFRETGWDSYDSIDYIEAHATSTQLGDLTELNALSNAMDSKITSGKKIPITSVKANIGHTLETAGMASLQKILLSLKHETILRQPNFGDLLRNFDWNRSPFYVPTTNIPWKPDHHRRAMVEAFGIGGLNAQVILEGSEVIHSHEDQKARASSGDPDPIAIIGTGCVLPGAYDIPAFEQMVKKSKSAIRSLSPDRPYTFLTRKEKNASGFSLDSWKGGFIDDYEYNWKLHMVPPKHIQFANPLQFMFLGAVDEAIQAAGYRSGLFGKGLGKPLDSQSTAVIAGTSTECDFRDALNLILAVPLLEKKLRKILQNANMSKEKSEALIRDFSESVYRHYPVLEDQTGGFSISTLASRITKTYDLTGGGTALDAGDVSSFAVLENGIHLLQYHPELQTVICVVGQRRMGIDVLKNYAACDRDGNVPGEGVVAFVLKRYSDALKDKDPILAVIRGLEGGFLGNAPEKAIDHYFSRLEAKIPDPNFMDPCFHGEILDGTSSLNTLVKDKIQTMNDGDHWIAKPSLRSLMGDLRETSGAAEILRMILEMKENKKSSAVLSQLDREGMFYQIFLERTFSGKIQKQKKKGVLKMSSNLPMEKENKPSEERSVSKSHEYLIRKFDTMMEKDKVVFMFPGQGSQYKMMLSGLFDKIPELGKTLEDFDRVLRKLGFPEFHDLTVKDANLLGKDVFRTQLALLIGDSLIAKYFENQGILPDIILGHSYGEYPALVASGVWTFETAAWMTWQRCRIIEECLMKGSDPSPNSIELFDTSSSTTMLSTNASAEQLHKLFEELWEQTVAEKSLFISNRNAPDQMIVSGTRKALVRLDEELKKRKFSAIILPVPAAYHSPLVGEVCDPLREVLDKVHFSVPKIALLSSVSMRFEADPDQFRTNLVDQMVRPVDFIKMIRKAYQNGGRFFVEVGTKRILEKLASKILVDCKDAQFFHCDNGKGGNTEEFRALCGNLHEIRQRITSYASAGVIRISGLNVEMDEVEKKDTRLQTKKSVLENRICESIRTGGTAYEIGYQYGTILGDSIRKTLRRYSDIALSPQNTLLAKVTSEIIHKADLFFGKDGNAELHGMAEGAGVPYESLLRHNLSVFPIEHQNAFDMLSKNRRAKGKANCVQFAGHLMDGDFVHGGNIDIAFNRIVPDALKYHLVVRRPKGKLASVSIVPTGLIGSRGGINASGISVSTCDLLDEDFVAAEPEGFRRGILIQTILDNCSTLESVRDLVQSYELCGAKSICVCDTQSGRILHLENVGKKIIVKMDEKSVVQANHSLLIKSFDPGDTRIPRHSLLRYQRLSELLAPSEQGQFARNANNVFAVLRDMKEYGIKENDLSEIKPRYRTMNMILRLDNAFSWMFNARSNMLQICLTESPYLKQETSGQWEMFDIRKLLPDFLAFHSESSVQNEEVNRQKDPRDHSLYPEGSKGSVKNDLISKEDHNQVNKTSNSIKDGTLFDKTDKTGKINGEKIAIFGNNAESRVLSDYFRLDAIRDQYPDLFIITTPCDPAVAKVRCPVQSQFRKILRKECLEELKNWIFRYKRFEMSPSSKIRILILKVPHFNNPMNYDEAGSLQDQIKDLLDSMEWTVYPKPEILIVNHDEILPPDQTIQEIVNKLASSEELVLIQENEVVKIEEKNGALRTDPLFHTIDSLKNEEEWSASLIIDPKKDTFLINHKLKGQAILPFVIATELFYEFALDFQKKMNCEGEIELRRIRSIRALLCTQDADWNIRENAVWDKTQKILKGRLTGDYYNPKGVLINKHCPYFSSEAVFCPKEPIRKQDLPLMDDLSYWDPDYPKDNNIQFYHGKPLQQLKRCYFIDDKTVLARIAIPDKNELIESRRDKESIILDAAVIDAGFWACGVLNGYRKKDVSVIPDQIETLKIRPNVFRPGETCFCLVKVTGEHQLPMGYRQIVFHLDFCNENHEVVYEIDNFRMTELVIPNQGSI